MNAVNPIPEEYDSITAHLIVDGAADAIEFYKKAFSAEEMFRMPSPDGKVLHAELKIGSSRFFMCDAFEMDPGSKPPTALGGSAVTLHLYVPDVDAAFKQAVDAGATAAMPPADMFWGDRYAKLSDPFGHIWSLGARIKDMKPEEVAAAAQAFFSEGPPC